MRVLAVECIGEALTMALSDGARLWRLRQSATPHDERLWPGLRRLLDKAGWRLNDIRAIACSSGPGRFTGVRLGMAFASSLGSSLGVPVVGVTVFEALAFIVRKYPRAPRRFCVALPAGHGLGAKGSELFVQAFGPSVAAGRPLWLSVRDSRISLIRMTRQGRDPFCGPAAAAAASSLGAGARVLNATLPWPIEAEHFIGPLLKRVKAGSPGPFIPLYLKPASFQRPASS